MSDSAGWRTDDMKYSMQPKALRERQSGECCVACRYGEYSVFSDLICTNSTVARIATPRNHWCYNYEGKT